MGELSLLLPLSHILCVYRSQFIFKIALLFGIIKSLNLAYRLMFKIKIKYKFCVCPYILGWVYLKSYSKGCLCIIIIIVIIIIYLFAYCNWADARWQWLHICT